jgi:hypothetical protein
MEEIARSQMSTSQVIMADVSAIRAKIVGGVVSAGQVLQTKEEIRDTVTNVSGEFSKMGTTKSVRDVTETGITDLKTLYYDLVEGNKDSVTAISDYLNRSGDLLGQVEKDFKKSLEETSKQIRANADDDSIEAKLIDKISGKINEQETALQQTSGNQVTSSLLEGRQTQVQQVVNNTASTTGTMKSTIDVGGTIKVEITAPAGTDSQTIDRAFYNLFNSEEFKNLVRNIQNEGRGLSPVTTTFGN